MFLVDARASAQSVDRPAGFLRLGRIERRQIHFGFIGIGIHRQISRRRPGRDRLRLGRNVQLLKVRHGVLL
ncbi:hypothetical protein AXXA_24580 [Achromobacter insuavis AXX-A]|uniref:Uncharacterized protein n=1 Tax=Achromobacter insuavis AXX-A TaxID=1003200 RepID=F7T7H4_9BURK|nr:hypothetical protein AXXA_24580 [Achromobacter insuavis AXX-A]